MSFGLRMSFGRMCRMEKLRHTLWRRCCPDEEIVNEWETDRYYGYEIVDHNKPESTVMMTLPNGVEVRMLNRTKVVMCKYSHIDIQD